MTPGRGAAPKPTPVTLGVTLGDPGGIGPEVVCKAVFGTRWPAGVRFVLYGSPALVETTADTLGLSTAALARGRVRICDPAAGRVVARPGRVTRTGARAAVAWIRAATADALAGRLDGIVTGPISKEGLALAGEPHPGHTELIAGQAGVRRFAMLLVGEPLRVLLVTRHIPLARVAASLRARDIADAIRMGDEALAWFGVENRCVGVCALNPHAGDGGVIGDEDGRIVAPAVRSARRAGVDVVGPVPTDVIFRQAYQGRYGMVIALYHDQGLGPLKMVAFDHGVNVTLGLPFVRTSPDHGTAFDIAGRGVANAASTCAAIRLALDLARRPNPWHPPRALAASLPRAR